MRHDRAVAALVSASRLRMGSWRNNGGDGSPGPSTGSRAACWSTVLPGLPAPNSCVTRWASTRACEHGPGYRGKGGLVSLLPRLASDNAGLVTVYSDIKSAYLQFWRGVFERRAPHSIPAVEAAARTELRQGNSTRNISPELLDAPTAYQKAAGPSEDNTMRPPIR